MKKKFKQTRLPKGWSLEQVHDILHYYETQDDVAAAKEDEAAYNARKTCMVAVPVKLLPRVRRLIASAS